MDLLNKIDKQNATVAIIGLGYVGLPLSMAFLNKGFHVIGLEIDQNKVEMLLNGNSYLSHLNLETLDGYVLEGKFKPTVDFSMVSEADVLIICVPTPLNKFREPDLGAVISSAEKISQYLKKNQLVVLESSTYPGTTDDLLTKKLEESGLKANRDFFIAYSPEREDPGNKEFTTSSIPKIVGADTDKSRELTTKLYKKVVEDVITVSSSRAAEATKLTENIFRSVNIALVNELKTIYDVMDIDVWEVIEAASTKPFGYMPFYPGPGLGGHCIPIDPFYLTYKAREYQVPTKFIELAGEINTSMPHYVLQKSINSLNEFSGKAINGSNVLLIGMAYKKDIEDLRESPSLILAKLLQEKKANVFYHDDYVPRIPKIKGFTELEGMVSSKLNKKEIESADLVLLITDHSYIDLKKLGKYSNLIVDTRNAMSKYQTRSIVVKA